MPRFSSRQLIIVTLVAIVLLGFFLRAYHFSSWLHFELDQARDARVIDAALLGGPGELTLLGPKAGGTFLRLAPGFYYLEYASALLFGGSPAGMAAVVLLFSVLSVPLFYFFVRRFFPVALALGLTALFSVSAYFVMYGRFAWNPNLMPFFILLGLYALLRSVDVAEPQKNRWFLVATGALVLATHFHFLVFLAVPVAVGIFLILKRPRFSWKVWSGVLLIVLCLYLPAALNEIEAGGTNTAEFFKAVTKKSTNDDHSLLEKALRDTSEHALHALVITTGFEGGTFPALLINHGLQSLCLEKCDQGKWYGVAALMVFLAGLLALIFLWWQEREPSKKDFLLLCGIWFGVTFTLFLPLAYNMAPRFFLLSGMLFFVFLGFLLLLFQQMVSTRLGKSGPRIATIIVWSVVGGLVFSNLYFLFGRFGELARAGTEKVENAPDRILKEPIRVTLEQQEKVVDMLQARSQETGFPVYMFSVSHHRRALKYLMEKRGIENAVLGFDGIYRQGVYYLILRSQSNITQALEKYQGSYSVGTSTAFGTLTVIELHPKPEAIIGERQDFSLKKTADSKAPPRYTWKEFLEWQRTPSADESETPLEESEDAEVEGL